MCRMRAYMRGRRRRRLSSSPYRNKTRGNMKSDVRALRHLYMCASIASHSVVEIRFGIEIEFFKELILIRGSWVSHALYVWIDRCCFVIEVRWEQYYFNTESRMIIVSYCTKDLMILMQYDEPSSICRKSYINIVRPCDAEPKEIVSRNRRNWSATNSKSNRSSTFLPLPGNSVAIFVIHIRQLVS